MANFRWFGILFGIGMLLVPACARADDTVELFDFVTNDTVGGRRAAYRFKLSYVGVNSCTVIFEYDTYVDDTYDSMTFYTNEGGAQNRGPLDGNGDSTPRYTCLTPGSTYSARWNVRADVPDTLIPNTRLRIRVFSADTGATLGETIVTPMGIRTVLAEPPETIAAQADQTDTVRFTWYQDTYAKYYVVWRDSGYPPNDTELFINVTRAVTGDDSKPDNYYYNAGLGQFRFIDTHVGKGPGERSPRIDTYWVWYITAIDTWDNQQELLTGYGDSIGAEFLFVRKLADSVSTKGERPGETIPGATLVYTITVSNTEGYTPAHNVRIVDFVPTNTEYKGTKVVSNIDINTRHRFITQTDTNDGDHVKFVMATATSDSLFVQIDTPIQPFLPGDTMRIRFRVVIK